MGGGYDPGADALEASAYTRARLDGDRIVVDSAPVRFTRVRPGESLLEETA